MTYPTATEPSLRITYYNMTYPATTTPSPLITYYNITHPATTEPRLQFYIDFLVGRV